MFSVDDLKAAQSVVYSQMLPTPQIHWPQLSLRTGAQVIVKHENHAPTGAFKVRGGITFIDWLKTHPPRGPRHYHRHPRQPRSIPSARSHRRRSGRQNLCAARQFGGKKRCHAGLWRRGD